MRKKPQGTTSFPYSKSPKSEQAYESILRYLARRDHSEKELRTKLSLRYTDEAIESAIQKAHENKWIKSPEDLSDLFGRYLDQRAKGILWINKELSKKGLPPKDPDFERELEKGMEVIRKKFPEASSLTYEEKQKAYRYLTSRGFEAETIRKVIYEKF